MSNLSFYPIGEISVVDVLGADAAQILHNLTTNDVKKLPVGSGCETFVTDVRGKTLGHVAAYRTELGFQLIGASGQSDAIVSHVDRYTIREDVTPTVRDADFKAIVVESREAIEQLAGSSTSVPNNPSLRWYELSKWNVLSYQVNWVSDTAEVLLVPNSRVDELSGACIEYGLTKRSEEEFHSDRIRNRYPWYGTDLSEKNLPQEADRNASAISFTKGCYLGQETVARLDALGQVQKKLVLWSIDGIPLAGSELLDGEKLVGRLTSVTAKSENQAVAIGVARRSHFEIGATAQIKLYGQKANDREMTATVISEFDE